MRHYLPLIFSIGLLSLLYGCGAKLSTAHVQYERGEYFAAATTYRKVYNKTPAKERDRRGQIAFRIGECYRRLNAAPDRPQAIKMQSGTTTPTAWRYFIWPVPNKCRENTKTPQKTTKLFSN